LWLTILLVWAIGAFSLTWEHRKPTWLFLSLVVVSADLSVRRGEARRGQDLPAPGGQKSGLSDARNRFSSHPGCCRNEDEERSIS
jgi:hypothetical protein